MSDHWRIYGSNIVSESDQCGSCGPYYLLGEVADRLTLPAVPNNTERRSDHTLIHDQMMARAALIVSIEHQRRKKCK